MNACSFNDDLSCPTGLVLACPIDVPGVFLQETPYHGQLIYCGKSDSTWKYYHQIIVISNINGPSCLPDMASNTGFTITSFMHGQSPTVGCNDPAFTSDCHLGTTLCCIISHCLTPSSESPTLGVLQTGILTMLQAVTDTQT